jgi:hypothetical protein
MNASINEGYALSCNQRSYRIQNLKTDAYVSHHGNLASVARYLIENGILPSEGVQLGWEALKITDRLADAFAAVCPDHAEAVKRMAVATFGKGAFTIIPNGPGGWILLNPGGTVPVLKDERAGKRITVGYPGTFQQALLLAAERVLRASTDPFPYAELNARFHALTRDLLADLSVSFDGGEPLELKALSPVQRSWDVPLLNPTPTVAA